MTFRSLLTAGAVLASALTATAADATAVREGKQVILRSGGKDILRYQAEPGEFPRKDIKEIFRRGGYIQSLFTPAGRLVTDDFPPNHIHHHGVWSPWTKTVFEGRQPDFWNMGEGKGRVEFVAVDGVWSKDGRAGFKARHRFIDMLAKPEKVALLETWEVSAEVIDGRNVVDITITQTCAGDSKLELPEYHYGGLGFRGNRVWDGAKNLRLLTASGLTDREKVNSAKEPWCWLGGKVDGETCGVAVVCDAGNFRAPQPIRLHPQEPFFCFAPQQAGPMSIEPGKEYVAKYRLIVADGEPDAEAIGKLAK